MIQLRSPLCLAGTVQATIWTADEPVAEVAWVVGTVAGLTPTGLVEAGKRGGA